VYAFIRGLCFDKTLQLFAAAALAGTHTVEALTDVEELASSEPAGMRYTSWKAREAYKNENTGPRMGPENAAGPHISVLRCAG
jgi:hypothetical protein